MILSCYCKLNLSINENQSGEKMEKKYGFVILHYLAEKMTAQCVDNILDRYNWNQIEIVIVDNASPNNSGKHLLERYAQIPNVTVLINSKNSGFAQGNNIGYCFLLENKKCDYIIVMNNDVLIDQIDFLDIIDELYNKEKYAVLGPDIYCPTWNVRQNPARIKGLSIQRVESLYNSYKRWCRHPLIHYCKDVVSDKLKKRSIQQIQGMEKINRDVAHLNVVLHGACYIFSPIFIKGRKFAFCPDTFLYMEEDILYYECSTLGYLMLYSPRIKVTHLEEVSTSANHKTAYSKKKMKYNETMKSLEVLKKEMSKEMQI